jgi:hypothetical protein
MIHSEIGVVCDRCGIGTEHYWSYKSKIETCHVCTDCLLNFVQHLIMHGELPPHKLVDWAKENAL